MTIRGAVAIGITANDAIRKAILDDSELKKIYKDKIFVGYVPANTRAKCNEYLYLHVVDDVVMDNGIVDGTTGDKLRRVRVQIDVADRVYASMKKLARMVRACLERAYPCCIDGGTEGLDPLTTEIVMNVASIDVILIEQEGV